MNTQSAVEALEFSFTPAMLKRLPGAGPNAGVVITDVNMARRCKRGT